MRKVSKEIAKAFIENRRKTMGNSWTEIDDLDGAIYLHDNRIAWWENNHPDLNLSNNIHLCFSMCGWGTPTTRERLNSLFSLLFESDDVFIQQKNFAQWLTINNRQIEIDEHATYVLRCIYGDLFLDVPMREVS